MNILENLEFSTEKANVHLIKKSDKIKHLAIALGQGAVLKKHTTAVPATIVVLKGQINFVLSDREYVFGEFDTFEIPVNEVHEVIGVMEQNLFLLTQEL